MMGEPLVITRVCSYWTVWKRLGVAEQAFEARGADLVELRFGFNGHKKSGLKARENLG